MKKFFTFCCVLLSITSYGKKDIWENQVQAIEHLKSTADGANWIFTDISALRERTFSPLIGDGRELSSTEVLIKTLDLSNNKLTGEITDEFVYKNDKFNFDYSSELLFSWNKLTQISSLLGHSEYISYCQKLMLDHNELTSFHSCNNTEYREKTGKHAGYNLYTGCKVFTLNNNEITKLKREDFGDFGGICLIIDNGADIIRVDNNRLDFESLCDIVPYLKKVVSKLDHYNPGNPDCVITYYPQKALGEDVEARTLNEGENVNLSFSLHHSKNVYTWQLNGKDLPLSETKNYSFNLSSESAGVYRCKITNPELPEITLYSKDMPVYLNKEGNNATSDINLKHNTIRENFPRLTIIGDLSATDPDKDEVFFRLPEKMGNNSSFRIKDGKTLLSAEELFDREFIESYEIVVEAYDIYGATFQKTFTLKKGEGSSTHTPLPKDITLSGNSIDENNSNAEIGILAAVGVEGYTFSLAQATMDNHMFVIEGTSLKTKQGLDYENKSVCSVRVIATTEDGTNMMKDFPITVNNINDNPHELILTNKSIKIDQPIGTLIGYLVTADQDSNDKNFTFKLAEDTEEIDNEIFAIDGTTLKSKFKYNTDHIGAKKVRIIVEDEHGGSLTGDLEISIVKEESNANNHLEILLSSNKIEENCTVNSTVGVLSIKGGNTDHFTFTLSDDSDQSDFMIDGNELKIKKSPNFEQKALYPLSIHANSTTENVTLRVDIIITDQNEAPVAIGLTNMFVPKNTKINTEIAQLVIEDPDGFDSFNISLENSDLFKLENKGILLAKEIPDQISQEDLNVTITDLGGLSYSQTISLKIDNDIRTEPILHTEILEVNSSSPIGTPVATFNVENPIGNYTFTIDNDLFEVAGNKIITKAILEKNLYLFTLTAQLNGQDLEKDILVEAPQLNIAPSRIGLDNFLLSKDWGAETAVATLFMKDENKDKASYTLLEGNEHFKIEGDQLILLSLNNEDVYNIKVEASDGKESISQEFSLFVPVIINGIDNINANDVDAEMYPNPVESVLNTTKSGNVIIYNSAGIMLKNEAIENSMNVSDLKTGMYIVVLQTDEGNKSFKIIKK